MIIKERAQRGVIFCSVARAAQIGHGELAITDGNQKWVGAAPNLVVRAIRVRVAGSRGGVRRIGLWESRGYERRSRHEPKAWARKYFIAASVSCFCRERSIKGIRERRFSSRAIHREIREEDETARAVLEIRTRVKEKLWGTRLNDIFYT